MTKHTTRAAATGPAPFHYTASGLPDVWLLNGFKVEHTPHGPGVRIKDADALHAALAQGIATGRHPMTAAELRFLRKHMALSQDGLARMLGCSDQTVARWEKGRTEIDPSAERLVRLLVLDFLGQEPQVRAALDELAGLDEAQHGARRLRLRGAVWRPAA